MGEWTMQEMMNLVEGYADLMKKAEHGAATEEQCTEIWEAIRRIAESWEISARQCQAFWTSALDIEREKWAQICDGFDAVNPHIGQAAEVAKLLRSNAELSGAELAKRPTQTPG